jgi:carboxyl-terminal processing protease
MTVHFPLRALLALTFLLPGCRDEKKSSQAAEVSAKVTLKTLLPEVLERVRTDYIEPISEAKMVENALNGIVNALDPYSAYLPPEDAEKLHAVNKGEFLGVGLELSPTPVGLKVITALDGSPAHTANIKSGDLITHINGYDITKFLSSNVKRLLHGGKDTPLCLTLTDQTTGERKDITLEQSSVRINPVRFDVNDHMGYLRLNIFNEHSEQEVLNALKTILNDHKLNGLIIDLRNNPGGTLEKSIAVTSLFLENGAPIVSVEGRTTSETIHYTSKGFDRVQGIPLIILVNKGTASGAEIFAGALKDHKRAIIIGSTTFGKGSVQTIFKLANNAALKLTTAYFFTPKKAKIHEKGIEPDISVIDIDGKDVPLQRAKELLHSVSFFNIKESSK